MKSNKIQPQFIKKYNPRIGLIALATDFIIEKDFIKIIKDKDIDFFVNRIECYNPLSKENLIKMSEKVTDVTKNILPDENIDCVVYGCTSGTIAVGHDTIERKVKEAKPKAKITTPSTAAIKALKKLKIKKIAIFTPYSKKLNDEVINYFSSEGFDIVANTYLDIAADYDIGKVDQNFLFKTLSSNLNIFFTINATCSLDAEPLPTIDCFISLGLNSFEDTSLCSAASMTDDFA